jgi:hypothetical protein
MIWVMTVHALSTNAMYLYQQLDLTVARSLAAPARAASKGLISQLPSKYKSSGLDAYQVSYLGPSASVIVFQF